MIDIDPKIRILRKKCKNSNLKCPLKIYCKNLVFFVFKASLCGKNITKVLNIDLTIILKTLNGKKFKF